METCLDNYAWDNFIKQADSIKYMTTLEDDKNQIMICITMNSKGWKLECLGRRNSEDIFKEEAVLLSHFLGDNITGKRFSKGKYAYKVNRQYKTDKSLEKALLSLIDAFNHDMGSNFILYHDLCMERNLHGWKWDSIEKNKFGKFFTYNSIEDNILLNITYYSISQKWFIYGVQQGIIVHKFFDTFEQMYQELETFDCINYLQSI